MNKQVKIILGIVIILILAVSTIIGLLIYDKFRPIDFKLVSTTEDKYLLLETFVVTIKAEPGLKVFNDNTLLGTTGEFNKDNAGNEVIEIVPTDEKNNLKIYAIDKDGDRTNEYTYEFDAFQKEGYITKTCAGLIIPVSPDLTDHLLAHNPNINIDENQKKDFADYIKSHNTNYNRCNDDEMRLNLYKKDDAFLNCVNCGGLGITSYSINFHLEEKTMDEHLAVIKDDEYSSILSDEIIENKSGLKIRLIKHQYGQIPDYLNYTTRFAVISANNKNYSLSISTSISYTDNSLEGYLKEILTNLEIK